jgi:putative membrane protein
MLTTLATTVAHGPYGVFPFFWIFPLLWFLLAVTVIVLVSRRWRRTGGPGWGPGASGESVLAERFARGDIDEVEYRARLEVLRSGRR